jgi:hypothetical protein
VKLRRPFEKLMELVDEAHNKEPQSKIRDLSKRWDETPERIMDAIDALRVKSGERTYIDLPEEKK